MKGDKWDIRLFLPANVSCWWENQQKYININFFYLAWTLHNMHNKTCKNRCRVFKIGSNHFMLIDKNNQQLLQISNISKCADFQYNSDWITYVAFLCSRFLTVIISSKLPLIDKVYMLKIKNIFFSLTDNSIKTVFTRKEYSVLHVNKVSFWQHLSVTSKDKWFFWSFFSKTYQLTVGLFVFYQP